MQRKGKHVLSLCVSVMGRVGRNPFPFYFSFFKHQYCKSESESGKSERLRKVERHEIRIL